MSSTRLSCTTATALVGQSRSSCVFLQSCSDSRTCASSSDTALVRAHTPWLIPMHCYCSDENVTLMRLISHLSAKEKGEKKLFGFSFVPLMQEDGRTLPDGTHELIVHKVSCGCLKEYSLFFKPVFICCICNVCVITTDKNFNLFPSTEKRVKRGKISIMCLDDIMYNVCLSRLVRAWPTASEEIYGCMFTQCW